MNLGTDLHDAYSMPQFAPLYPDGPYRYEGARAVVLTFPFDEELHRRVMPEPLAVPSRSICSLWFFDYPRVSGFGAYTEFVLGVTAEHDGEPLMYVVYEGLDSEVPICAGREKHGTGKKLGTVRLWEDGNVYGGAYSRGGVDVATATVEGSAPTDDHPLTRAESTVAYWKRIPSAQKGAPPAVDRITVSKTRDIEVHWALTGPATVQFQPSASDPLSVFEPEAEATGYYLEFDMVLDDAEDAVLHVFDEFRP
ncbi:MAG TPA: acetoacetate decarboxylase family protein [Halobacteriales archaeon]|nr:acetoacetate decarboxylase family protein [Halobacteriales archaeon]